MHPRGLASLPPLATSSSAPAGWIQSASPAATPHSATAPRGSVPPTRRQRPPCRRTGLFFFSCSHCCSSYWRRWCSRHNFAVQFVFCLNHLKEFTFPIRIKVKFVKESMVLKPHKRGDNMTVDLMFFLGFFKSVWPKMTEALSLSNTTVITQVRAKRHLSTDFCKNQRVFTNFPVGAIKKMQVSDTFALLSPCTQGKCIHHSCGVYFSINRWYKQGYSLLQSQWSIAAELLLLK